MDLFHVGFDSLLTFIESILPGILFIVLTPSKKNYKTADKFRKKQRTKRILANIFKVVALLVIVGHFYHIKIKKKLVILEITIAKVKT